MFGYNRIVIAEHERGILLENRSVVGILGPGVYRQWDPLKRREVQVHDLNRPEFEHPQVDVLLKEHSELCERHFQLVELNEQQVGLVYKQGLLSGLLAPASRVLYWKGLVEIKVGVIDISEEFHLSKELAQQLARARSTSEFYKEAVNAIYPVEVADNHIGLLIVDGELSGTLQPGLHAFWRYNRNLKVELVDTRVQAMEVQGQEILTKDKVSLRINLSANYRVTDAVKARSELGNFSEHLYRTLQFGLRQTVGTRSLDQLLGNKGELDQAVFEYVAADSAPFGLKLESIGIKDIILPGDMKDILNQVVEAEKVAQANIIRRREETAATRSLLNTAKLMDENPTLLRLKELETLEKVTDKVGNLTVFGGLDGVLSDTVRINIRG